MHAALRFKKIRTGWLGIKLIHIEGSFFLKVRMVNIIFNKMSDFITFKERVPSLYVCLV
jgi:hypothetical protein